MAKDLTEALHRLTEQARQRPVATPQERGAAARVVSAASPGGGTAKGGSIASPLTEQARTYHAERTVMSTDGLFGFRVTPVATISFTDANGAGVVFNFADTP